MSDGVQLATDDYLPAKGKPPFPGMLLRTPYNKNGNGATAATVARFGYALVVQDMRGRFASEVHHAIIFGNDGIGGQHHATPGRVGSSVPRSFRCPTQVRIDRQSRWWWTEEQRKHILDGTTVSPTRLRPAVLSDLDRLSHRCHILETKGERYSFHDAKRRKGNDGVDDETTDLVGPSLQTCQRHNRSHLGELQQPSATKFDHPAPPLSHAVNTHTRNVRLNSPRGDRPRTDLLSVLPLRNQN